MVSGNVCSDAQKRLNLIGHALSHALTPVFERELKLDPCPAMKLASEVAGQVDRSLGYYAADLDRLMMEQVAELQHQNSSLRFALRSAMLLLEHDRAGIARTGISDGTGTVCQGLEQEV